jgi:hypothetical protein
MTSHNDILEQNVDSQKKIFLGAIAWWFIMIPHQFDCITKTRIDGQGVGCLQLLPMGLEL